VLWPLLSLGGAASDEAKVQRSVAVLRFRVAVCHALLVAAAVTVMNVKDVPLLQGGIENVPRPVSNAQRAKLGHCEQAV
jgi:hypothetical protein